ncbi:Putative aminotransferase [Yarrowia lipolytica]|nr:Putative aminotransferase [Yarrowia lipolytica]
MLLPKADDYPTSIANTDSPIAPLTMSIFQNAVNADLPRAIAGKGSYLTLENPKTGAQYDILDGSSGAAVAAVGHNHPRIVQAMQHCAGLPYIFTHAVGSKQADDLAELILSKSNGAFSRALFLNSGSEANETAMKIATQFFYEQGQTQRCNFISRDFSYHGNTLGSLSLGGFKSRQVPYKEILNSKAFHKVSTCFPYRHQKDGQTEEQYTQMLLDELDAKFQELGPDTVIAFVCETVIGATLGAVPPSKGYISGCRDICHKYGALFLLDEVMCGMGRTGTYHAWEPEFEAGTGGPDIQTVAKVLGGGYVPLAGVLLSPKVFDVFQKGSGIVYGHQTYQDHVFATGVALEIQRLIFDQNLIEECFEMGKYLGMALKRKFADNPYVGDVRGRGLFWDVEFVADKATKEVFPASMNLAGIMHVRCIENGAHFLKGKGTIDSVLGDHMMVSPAYTVTRVEIDRMIDVLANTLAEVLAENGYN